MTSQHMVFETERLLIRAATEGDIDLLYELWTNPRVMSYVGFPQGLRITREKIKQQVRGRSRELSNEIAVQINAMKGSLQDKEGEIVNKAEAKIDGLTKSFADSLTSMEKSITNTGDAILENIQIKIDAGIQ